MSSEKLPCNRSVLFTEMETNTYLPTIWAVDDNPHNLTLLEKILSRENFQFISFSCGNKLLRSIKRAKPDLLLLDIDMPDLSGYQICEAAKTDPDTAQIPIIFISALDNIQDKRKGFDTGGVDYITKPFDAEEVIMRVKNHLLLSSLQSQLANQNMELETIVQQRTAELKEANQRLKRLDNVKSDFLKFISHELRTPLNGLLGFVDLLLEELDSEIDENLGFMYQQSRRRTLSLIDDALLLNEIEAQPENYPANPVVVCNLLQMAIQHAEGIEKNLQIELPFELSTSLGVKGDQDLLIKALSYLLATAYKFCGPDFPLQICIEKDESTIRLYLIARGKSIKNLKVDAFFDFHTAERSYSYAESMGLAPVVAQKILSLFDGTVSLTKSNETEVTFMVTLPSQ